MQVDIKTLGFPITDALREHVRRRLGHVLGGRDESMRRVTVWLSDFNGLRGGEDKCCHIQIALFGVPDVIVKDTDPDLYMAIDRGVARAGRALSRRLARQRIRRRLFGPRRAQSNSDGPRFEPSSSPGS